MVFEVLAWKMQRSVSTLALLAILASSLSSTWTHRLCAILLLVLALNLFNPASAHAQSSVITTPNSSSSNFSAAQNSVPNSISPAQRATESMLQQPVSTIGINYDQDLSTAEVIDSLNVVVFIDVNLEGILDLDTEMTMKAGVSIGMALKRALTKNDAKMITESDGSILLISIDDEGEPDYMRTVTHDVTSITGSVDHTSKLAYVLQNSIRSDSWEQNGGGNATISIYHKNGHVLMTIFQSYDAHLDIREYFQTLARLSGSSVLRSPNNQLNIRPVISPPSSVVAVPAKQTMSALRSRRGFARPNSGMAGGMGGGKGGSGGGKGGGLF